MVDHQSITGTGVGVINVYSDISYILIIPHSSQFYLQYKINSWWKQNGIMFQTAFSKYIFFNEIYSILIQISLKYVSDDPAAVRISVGSGKQVTSHYLH